MYIGIMKIELRFQAVTSIKVKRNIINKVRMRLNSRFKISIAEAEDQDLYNSSVLGLCFVSNKKDHAVSKCQNILTFLEEHESDVFHDYNFVVEQY
jgi:uncharacterized protein